jgi:hypothetical protein
MDAGRVKEQIGLERIGQRGIAAQRNGGHGERVAHDDAAVERAVVERIAAHEDATTDADLLGVGERAAGQPADDLGVERDPAAEPDRTRIAHVEIEIMRVADATVAIASKRFAVVRRADRARVDVDRRGDAVAPERVSPALLAVSLVVAVTFRLRSSSVGPVSGRITVVWPKPSRIATEPAAAMVSRTRSRLASPNRVRVLGQIECANWMPWDVAAVVSEAR